MKKLLLLLFLLFTDLHTLAQEPNIFPLDGGRPEGGRSGDAQGIYRNVPTEVNLNVKIPQLENFLLNLTQQKGAGQGGSAIITPFTLTNITNDLNSLNSDLEKLTPTCSCETEKEKSLSELLGKANTLLDSVKQNKVDLVSSTSLQVVFGNISQVQKVCMCDNEREQLINNLKLRSKELSTKIENLKQ